MKRMLLAMFVSSLLAVAAFAQVTTGQLTGTVSGPDGVVAGATVVVIDVKTNKELTGTATGEGSFAFPQLEVGVYTVRVTAPGFKTFTATDVKIDAARPYTLNPTLQVGGIEESVTVVAGADIVNATNAELSNTVSPRQILELPINGRNPLSLLNLQAGVNATSSSINGQRSSSANYTRDGINIQDNYIRTGGFVQDRPSVDDTGEFTVTTQNAGAELGGGGSTQVQLVTPRGGSDVNGALFIYNRNSAFAANQFFSNATGSERPFLNRNQFGGKIGGPMPVPNFGEGGPSLERGKGFFFFSYERFELRQQAAITRTILLPNARQGLFTYVPTCDSNPATAPPPCPAGIVEGQPRTINVLTGQGLAGPIPAAAGGVLSIDPIIQSRILDNIPTAGNGLITNGGVSQELRFNQADNDVRNAFTTRLDFDFNDRNSFNFVYKFNDNADDRQSDTGGFDTRPFVTQGGPTNLLIGTFRTTLGDRFTNETRGAYQRSEPFFNQGPVPQDFIIGGIPFASNPQATFRDQGRNTDLYVLQNNASYILGNHSLRFGGQVEWHRIESVTNFDTVPTFSITGTANPNTPRLPLALFPGGIGTTDRGRADALRYFLGGVIGTGFVAANFVDQTQGTIVGAPNVDRFKYNTLGLYVSDQWRATPRLTLTLGLRYDVFTGLENPDVAYLEPVIPAGANIRDALLDPNGSYNFVGTNTGTPGKFFNTDKNNFGPNISVAWSPQFKNKFLGGVLPGDGRTVIRGGFRVGFVNDEFIRSSDNAAGGNTGLDTTFTLSNLNRRLNSLPSFPTPTRLTLPVSFAARNRTPGQSFFNTVFAVDPDLQLQRNLEYNVGIQREIGFNMAVELRYVGGMSNSLVRGRDFNQLRLSPAFLTDFNNARFNLLNFGLNNCTAPGCRPVGAFFNTLVAPGLDLFNDVLGSAFDSLIEGGVPADFALATINPNAAFFPGAQRAFLANPNAGVVDLLENGARYRYNSLQAEIRRRFTQGFSFQANYTFQKILTDVQSDQQTRFDPLLDLARPELEYARPDYDRTHTININTIYELPFGNGKRFLNEGGLIDRIFGGFQVTSIINISSGPPITILDPRGTLNRAGRSARQTANSPLTDDQIKNLVGVFNTPNGVFAINPDVLFATAVRRNAAGAIVETRTGVNLREQLPAGFVISEIRGASAINTPAFAGQVFFRNEPGQTGSLPRNFINGPMYFNWDAGLIKNIRLTEGTRLQLRAEAFNVLNNVNFFGIENSGIFNINSTSFGRISTAYSPRIMQFAARFEF